LSVLKPVLQFSLKNKLWQIEHQYKFDLKLKAAKAQPAAWYRISVIAKNKAAKQFFANNGSFWVNQNHNTISASLLPEAEDKHALVFLRHNPLHSLTLHWHNLSTTADAPEFQIRLRQISAATAWFYMLTQVSRKHAAEGIGRSYIFKISRARSKRAGIQVALSKLIKEYQPQLSYQLISCEPYSLWRQTKEQKLLQPHRCQTTQVNTRFHLVVKAKEHPKALAATLNSIQIQSYANWQVSLCQVTTSAVVLDETIKLDTRINLTAHLNVAVDDYLIFLEEGDQLASDCLSILAEQLQQQPKAIIYSDHDLLNDTLLRVAPRFKPQWNPDLLMHQNYIGQAFAVQAKRLQAIWQEPHWWLQHHYVLLLQAVMAISPAERANQITRIPLMLFHQALHNQKQAYSVNTQRRVKALLQQLSAQSNEPLLAINKGKAPNMFHLRYQIPKPWPLVSLIIPTRDALDITRTCVNSILFLTQYPHYEIIIVDNQSSQQETLAWFEQISQHEKVRVLQYDKPFNYSAINNFAVKHAKGSVIGLVNNDTEVINKGWLTEMLQHACRPDIGCVGAKLYYFDDTVQHGGVILGLWGLAGHSHKNFLRHEKGHQGRLISVQNLSAVTAACLLVRKSVYEEVAGLEEFHLTVAFNDVDFCLKVQQAGYRNLWTPYAELYHYESKSRGKEDTPEKKAREQAEISYMQQKWPAVIADDPHYNPNLTRLREDFSINIDETN